MNKKWFLVLLLSSGSTWAMNTISTVGGSGATGFGGDGSAATSASLNNPTGVAVDAAGNVFVADRDNHAVRRIDAVTGLISTVVGNGTAGLGAAGAVAAGPVLKTPNGVAIDGSGNLFIADTGNNRVIELASGATTITVTAGTGAAGFMGDGAGGASALLSAPAGVAADSSGNVFIADTGNSRIRKVSVPTTGIINTVAGSATAGAAGDGAAAIMAQLNGPTGVCVDSSGIFYIADQGNQKIRKVDGLGNISTFAGTGTAGSSGDGSAASAATLSAPTGVALDSTGALFIADSGNSRIRRVDGVTGLIATDAGTTSGFSGDGGDPVAAQLNNPTGVVTSGTSYYITDQKNQRIRLAGATSTPPPSITSVTIAPMPVPTNTPATFTATGTTTTNKTLTFTWSFGDGSPPASGATVAHVYASNNNGTPFTVVVTVSDGIQSVPNGNGVQLQVLAPASGADGVKNVSQGKTDQNPVSLLAAGVPTSIQAPASSNLASAPGSNGGIVNVNTDQSAVKADFSRAAGTVRVTTTDPVSASQVALTGPTTNKGNLIAHRFIQPGMFLAISEVVDANNNVMSDSNNHVLRARKTIAISDRDLGASVAGRTEPGGHDIALSKFTGKFALVKSSPASLESAGASTAASRSAKADSVIILGTIELPGGLDVSQPLDMVVGVGNVIDRVTVVTKGVSGLSGAGAMGLVKKVQVKYPPTAKKQPVLPAQQQAKVTIQLSGFDLATKGFDTEGVTNDNAAAKAKGGSMIRVQVLLTFGGESYEVYAPIVLTISKKGDSASGTTAHR